MKRSGKRLTCAVILAVLMMSGLTWAQPGAGGNRGNRGNFDPAQMQQRMAERMMEQLGVSADEWKVIEPLYTKVTQLQRDAMGRGMRGMRGNRGNRGGAATEQNAADLNPVQKAQEELRTLLENTNATSDQIKAKLTALRQQREKARQELAKAQEVLRKVLSLKQEAQLVLMGNLE